MAIRNRSSKDSALPNPKRQAESRSNMLKTGDLGSLPIGQLWPSHWPTAGEPQESRPGLGRPLTIRQVAAMLGCSPWSVRNTWMPKGLPFVRTGECSRIYFFEEQIIDWLKEQQGGNGF
jgi:hypothetical protein